MNLKTVQYILLFLDILLFLALYSFKAHAGEINSANVTVIFDEEMSKKGGLTVDATVYSFFYIKAPEFHESKARYMVDKQLIFDIDLNHDISLLQLDILTADGEKLLYHPDNLFLVEKGDSLIFDIGKRIAFRGYGNEKNQVRHNVRKVAKDDMTSWFYNYLTNGEINRYHQVYDDYFDALISMKLDYLKKQSKQHKMTESAYRYVADEVRFEVERMRVNRLLSSVEYGAPYRERLMQSNIEKLKSERDRFISYRGQNYAHIHYLMDFVVAGYYMQYYTKNRDSRGIVPEIDSVYNRIKSLSLPDHIKDQLNTFLFTRFETYGIKGESVIDSAIATVSNIKMTVYLREIRSRRYVRDTMYPFRFEDINGTIYRPDDFKGKKVIFDFWFNGCTGCAVLHRYLQQMENQIDDPDVLFVTVNVDRHRDRWLEGLESGKFTNDSGLNLRVVDNPPNILSYYEFISYPQLLVMDQEGKLGSYNPPKPITPESAKMFRELLNGL